MAANHVGFQKAAGITPPSSSVLSADTTPITAVLVVSPQSLSTQYHVVKLTAVARMGTCDWKDDDILSGIAW